MSTKLRHRGLFPVWLLVSLLLTPGAAWGAMLPAAPVSVGLPPPAATAFEVAVAYGPGDGLLYVWTGEAILRQTAIDSPSFISQGAVGSGSADAGPIAFSRDGGTLVVGNGSGGFVPAGNAGLLFAVPASGGSSATPVADVPFHYSLVATPVGAPANTFFLNQGNVTFTQSSVSLFDAVSGGNVPVIQNIPGASSSMAIDAAGRLYVGIGFGPERGELRRFTWASLQAAHAGGTPLDWTAGELFNDLDNNSGAGMFVDARGYLFVGGPQGVTVFDTAGNFVLYDNGGFTTVDYDPFGDRLLVRGFGDRQGVYLAAALVVPEPSSLVLLLAAALCLLPRRRTNRSVHSTLTLRRID